MKIILFRTIKRSLIIFSIITLLFLTLLYTSFIIEKNSYIEKISLSLEGDVNTYKETFSDEVAGIASDINIMKQLLTFHDVLTIEEGETVFVSEETKNTVENSFLVMAQSLSYFDQIRVLNTQGMEISRVNYNNGFPYIVEDSQLQDKSNRDYFLDSISLSDQTICISALDLNIENNMIEMVDGRTKPILRFSTPLYTSSNQLLGILVINYLVHDIFDDLYLLKQTLGSDIAIINDDGYYLYSEDVSRTFGFMYDDMQDETVNNYVSFDILAHASSNLEQFRENQYIYTTLALDETLFATEINRVIGNDMTFVSNYGPFIIYNELQYTALSEYQQKINTYIGLAIFSIILAYLITRLFDELNHIKREKIIALEYAANHDFLTGLPNRAYMMTLINECVTKNKTFSLMYIDMDGFKNINDQYGHIVGDDALIEGSKRITNNIREMDVVARVGGDEFIILFDQLTEKATLAGIAQRILDAYKNPFHIQDVSTTLGVSIGIASYYRGQTVDDLIRAADQTMYKVKQNQKNNYQFYKS